VYSSISDVPCRAPSPTALLTEPAELVAGKNPAQLVLVFDQPDPRELVVGGDELCGHVRAEQRVEAAKLIRNADAPRVRDDRKLGDRGDQLQAG
jgi:hypothetical protein